MQRAGGRLPLLPGTQLRAGDQVFTGAGARLLIKLAEGSVVKLGENAQMTFAEVARSMDLCKAVLDVLQGAFRFTTELIGQKRKREVDIRVANVTAGIRGTDLWGKSTADRDWVVLLEGKIQVGSEGNPSVTLDKPLDLYQVPRGAAPEVTRSDQKTVDEWAAETELLKDGPAAEKGGRWRTVAAVKRQRDEARALVRTLRAAGFPGEIVAKEDYFIVQVSGLASEAAARGLVAAIRTLPGAELPSAHEGPP